MIEHQWEIRGLLRRHFGIVTAADIKESDIWLHADPRFSTVDYLIEDLRGCANLLGIDAVSLRRSAGTHAPFLSWPDGFRHAWVARWSPPSLSDLAATGMKTASQRLRTFRFIADARDWIGAATAPALEDCDSP